MTTLFSLAYQFVVVVVWSRADLEWR